MRLTIIYQALYVFFVFKQLAEGAIFDLVLVNRLSLAYSFLLQIFPNCWHRLKIDLKLDVWALVHHDQGPGFDPI